MVAPTPICIAHIETGQKLYGGALQVLYLLTALRNTTDSYLIATKGSSIIAAAKRLKIPCYELSDAGDFQYQMYREIKNILNTKRPSLVHVHSRRGADIFGGLAARSCNIPAVISRRVDNIPPIWWVVAQHFLYKKIICISPTIQSVLENAGIPLHRLRTIASGVNTQVWKPLASSEVRSKIREKFGIAESHAFFVMVAQLIPRKGHIRLFTALEKLPKHYQYQLCLFGIGKLEKKLMHEIKKRGLEDRVRCVGFHESLHEIIPAADLIIHPVYREGLGVSLLQAAAAEVPVVASKAGGIKDVFTHKETAYLVSTENVDELVLAIKYFFNDRDDFSHYALCAREMVERDYKFEIMAQKNYKLYEEIAELKKPSFL